MSVCGGECTCACESVCMGGYMHAPMNGRIWVFVCECIHVAMPVLMKVCVYIYFACMMTLIIRTSL